MLKKGIVKVFVSALLAFTPVLANAVVITLDPSDFGAGVPLENDYVKAFSTEGSLGVKPWPLTGYPGGSSFGVYELVPPLVTQEGEVLRDWGGLLFQFNQEVSNVVILASETDGDRPWWAGGAAWVAFDKDKKQIGYTGTTQPPQGSPFGATYEVNVRRDGIWSVMVGGAGFRSTAFHHLTFAIDELPDASVPAPNPLVLLLMGLAMITLRAKFRAQSK